eukprot:3940460-Rhodomonas_salina.2
MSRDNSSRNFLKSQVASVSDMPPNLSPCSNNNSEKPLQKALSRYSNPLWDWAKQAHCRTEDGARCTEREEKREENIEKR